MDVNAFVKLFETVGYPVLTALAMGYCLFWLLRWLVARFSKDLQQEYQHIYKEIDSQREDIADSKVIVIRLIDRIRLLSDEVYAHDMVARTVWGLKPRPDRQRTRSERRELLEDELADIGKNGIGGEKK